LNPSVRPYPFHSANPPSLSTNLGKTREPVLERHRLYGSPLPTHTATSMRMPPLLAGCAFLKMERGLLMGAEGALCQAVTPAFVGRVGGWAAIGDYTTCQCLTTSIAIANLPHSECTLHTLTATLCCAGEQSHVQQTRIQLRGRGNSVVLDLLE